MRFAILGLSQSGKSSLFRILCGPQAGSESYGLQVGVAPVPDERLDRLVEIYQPKKITRATVEFLDTPGLVNDPEKDTQVLSQVRGADAFAVVLRCFDDAADPAGELAALETEFLLVDHATVSKRLERVRKEVQKAKSKEAELELGLLERVEQALAGETPVRSLEWTAEEKKALRGFMLLTAKPLLVVLNAPESAAAELDGVAQRFGVASWSGKPSVEVTAICGSIEAELAELDPAEAGEFLASYGLEQSARGRMVQAARQLLQLMTVFTAGETECRSWFIPRQASALEFAGVIHSDIAKRFVKAEVVAYEDLVSHGTMAGAREKGLVRLEGKQYEVQEGDVVYIRHSA